VKYAVFVPQDYRGDKPYPLVLFLNGTGQAGEDGVKPLGAALPLSIRKVESTFGMIVLLPQNRRGTWDVPSDDMERTDAILQEVERAYRIDPSRLYLTGVSSGGVGTWNVARQDPARWAAVVPIGTSLAIDPLHARRIHGIPCWAFHTCDDKKQLVEPQRRLMGALRAAGGAPILTEYVYVAPDEPGLNYQHYCFEKAYELPELYDWLTAQHLE
jgi:predicted peptidase